MPAQLCGRGWGWALELPSELDPAWMLDCGSGSGALRPRFLNAKKDVASGLAADRRVPQVPPHPRGWQTFQKFCSPPRRRLPPWLESCAPGNAPRQECFQMAPGRPRAMKEGFHPCPARVLPAAEWQGTRRLPQNSPRPREGEDRLKRHRCHRRPRSDRRPHAPVPAVCAEELPEIVRR